MIDNVRGHCRSDSQRAGDADEIEGPTIEISFPAKFEMRCKTCGTIHSYTLGDLEYFQSEESLPLGFEVVGHGFRIDAGSPR
jgi:hypothetical protein